jgi:hypothetical protein
LQRTRKVDRADGSTCEVLHRFFGWKLVVCEIVFRPAREDQHLRFERGLPQHISKPTQPRGVGMHEVII